MRQSPGQAHPHAGICAGCARADVREDGERGWRADEALADHDGLHDAVFEQLQRGSDLPAARSGRSVSLRPGEHSSQRW